MTTDSFNPAGAHEDISRKRALQFVILIGIVSLFADMTYEGARSITGPYLAILGAGATAVGLVAGLGELLGYALRFLSGYLADRTGRYWVLAFLGYGLNLAAVPLLAWVGSWETAAFLILLERIGKAIRAPARDAMLSHATQRMGHGWGFGLHEALDQIGATVGPLMIAAVLALRGDYRTGFAVLLLPVILSLGVLLFARRRYPHPHDLEVKLSPLETKGYPRAFWIYLAAVAFLAAGYADFPLIAYHFKKVGTVSDTWIPLLYAVAMGADVLSALFFGSLFDRRGIVVLAGASFLSAWFAPLVFFGGFYSALAGAALWGAGMGAQESIMRAAIAVMIPATRRGTAYGLFNMGYGVFWFIGSALMGVLYEISVLSIALFSIGMQLLSVPLFLWARKVSSTIGDRPLPSGRTES